MQVQEIMTPRAKVINPNTNIAEAARTMRADNIGSLPVGENDRLIGMVTDRDIAMRSPRTVRTGTRQCARSCRNTSSIVSRMTTSNRPRRSWRTIRSIVFQC